ncbi:hypothetical protein SISNIDRAFT_467189 [Sistotremastrum niveocremeum HHB9708]|uniref:Uncharacterized protein n=1 Tax=Sistotremastrum niveocremeum HHB9708 TaxID=1314777 RepID=A0A164SZS2_9AGAM|nr:hypothetical protein SISNIDRAFT_467189 [Sistotremastrum niveocremeum HHB9708]
MAQAAQLEQQIILNLDFLVQKYSETYPTIQAEAERVIQSINKGVMLTPQELDFLVDPFASYEEKRTVHVTVEPIFRRLYFRTRALALTDHGSVREYLGSARQAVALSVESRSHFNP